MFNLSQDEVDLEAKDRDAPNLSPEQEAFVRQCIEADLFEDLSDLLSCAVGFLQDLPEHELHKLSELRKSLKKAFSGFERGEFQSYTAENLHELFDSIRQGISPLLNEFLGHQNQRLRLAGDGKCFSLDSGAFLGSKGTQSIEICCMLPLPKSLKIL